jgi:hypothetical protein
MESFDNNGYIIFDSDLFKQKFPYACLNSSINKDYLREILLNAKKIDEYVPKDFKKYDKNDIIAGNISYKIIYIK